MDTIYSDTDIHTGHNNRLSEFPPILSQEDKKFAAQGNRKLHSHNRLELLKIKDSTCNSLSILILPESEEFTGFEQYVDKLAEKEKQVNIITDLE